MEYKQGLDRAGDNTHFPFPIKLEYDKYLSNTTMDS